MNPGKNPYEFQLEASKARGKPGWIDRTRILTNAVSLVCLFGGFVNTFGRFLAVTLSATPGKNDLEDGSATIALSFFPVAIAFGSIGIISSMVAMSFRGWNRPTVVLGFVFHLFLAAIVGFAYLVAMWMYQAVD